MHKRRTVHSRPSLQILAKGEAGQRWPPVTTTAYHEADNQPHGPLSVSNPASQQTTKKPPQNQYNTPILKPAGKGFKRGASLRRPVTPVKQYSLPADAGLLVSPIPSAADRRNHALPAVENGPPRPDRLRSPDRAMGKGTERGHPFAGVGPAPPGLAPGVFLPYNRDSRSPLTREFLTLQTRRSTTKAVPARRTTSTFAT